MNWQAEIERIHEQAIKKSGIRPWSSEDVRFLALALCSEAGELAHLIKKEWRAGIYPGWTAHVHTELADIRVYLHLLSVALSVDLDEAIAERLPAIREKFPCSPPKA